jgi:hypothetical protein
MNVWIKFENNFEFFGIVDCTRIRCICVHNLQCLLINIKQIIVEFEFTKFLICLQVVYLSCPWQYGLLKDLYFQHVHKSINIFLQNCYCEMLLSFTWFFFTWYLTSSNSLTHNNNQLAISKFVYKMKVKLIVHEL